MEVVDVLLKDDLWLPANNGPIDCFLVFARTDLKVVVALKQFYLVLPTCG